MAQLRYFEKKKGFFTADKHSLVTRNRFLEDMEMNISSHSIINKIARKHYFLQRKLTLPFFWVKRCLHYVMRVFTVPRTHVLLVHLARPMKMELVTKPYASGCCCIVLQNTLKPTHQPNLLALWTSRWVILLSNYV